MMRFIPYEQLAQRTMVAQLFKGGSDPLQVCRISGPLREDNAHTSGMHDPMACFYFVDGML